MSEGNAVRERRAVSVDQRSAKPDVVNPAMARRGADLERWDGMKSLVLSLAIAILAAGCAGESNPVPLVQIDTRDFNKNQNFMRIVELERDANTSKLRLTYSAMGSSVASSMFIMRGFYEVAKARGAEYFVNLKEWDDEEGGRIYIAGFTNNKNADLKVEFGEEYSYENESGQRRGFMSVSQLKTLYEKPNIGIDSGDAANK